MSVNKRKVAYYSIQFRRRETNEILVYDELITYFNSLLSTIINKEFAEKKVIIESSNKFYYMADYTDDEFINIRFEAAKIGHRPFLVDEETGDKRENPKRIHEGEAEISHLALKFKDDEIIIALEERMVGVTIKQIVSYLRTYIREQLPENRCEVDYYYIEYDDFIEKLRSLSNVKVCEIYFDKTQLGSEFLNNVPIDRSTRDSVELILKSHVRRSIRKSMVERIYNITGDGQIIDRIRVEGNQRDDAKIKLDSDSFKLIKFIDVEVDDDTGIVNSIDMFSKLNDNLREMN